MPDPLFQDLYDETRQLHWPAAEQVRRRAAQRTRRQRLAAATAAAVAVVAVAGGAMALGQPRAFAPAPADSGTSAPASAPATASPPRVGASPSRPGPSAVPTPTQVPPSRVAGDGRPRVDPDTGPATPGPGGTGAVPAIAMLQPADLPPGYDKIADKTRDTGSDGGLSYSFTYCRGGTWPNAPVRAERGRTLLHTGRPDTMVVQRVVRYPDGDAAKRQFADSHAALSGCQRSDPRSSVSIVALNFAGQKSLLVHTVFEPGSEVRHVLILQGDLISELWAKPAMTQPELMLLARAAQLRLCRATTC